MLRYFCNAIKKQKNWKWNPREEKHDTSRKLLFSSTLDFFFSPVKLVFMATPIISHKTLLKGEKYRGLD